MPQVLVSGVEKDKTIQTYGEKDKWDNEMRIKDFKPVMNGENDKKNKKTPNIEFCCCC